MFSIRYSINVSTISVQSFIHAVVLLLLMGNLKDFYRLIFFFLLWMAFLPGTQILNRMQLSVTHSTPLSALPGKGQFFLSTKHDVLSG